MLKSIIGNLQKFEVLTVNLTAKDMKGEWGILHNVDLTKVKMGYGLVEYKYQSEPSCVWSLELWLLMICYTTCAHISISGTSCYCCCGSFCHIYYHYICCCYGMTHSYPAGDLEGLGPRQSLGFPMNINPRTMTGVGGGTFDQICFKFQVFIMVSVINSNVSIWFYTIQRRSIISGKYLIPSSWLVKLLSEQSLFFQSVVSTL